MKKSIKMEVEKIANGYLFTKIDDGAPREKVYNEHKDKFFDILKEDENIGGLMDDNDEAMIFEIIRHDVEIPNTNNQLLENIVEKQVYSPFPAKTVDEDALRLSVTKANAYTAARLNKIDWNDLDKQLPLSMSDKARICGMPYSSMYALYKKIKEKNGEGCFTFEVTRVYITVLAKYYEAVLGVQSSTKDELSKMKTGIAEQIKELDVIFNKHTHVHSNHVEPIIVALKKLIGVKE